MPEPVGIANLPNQRYVIDQFLENNTWLKTQY